MKNKIFNKKQRIQTKLENVQKVKRVIHVPKEMEELTYLLQILSTELQIQTIKIVETLKSQKMISN